MLKRSSLKRYNRQIWAIVEKNIFIDMRIKSQVVSRFLNPIIQLLVLVFIFGLLFNIKEGFSLGYWNVKNYMLFILLAFCTQFSSSIINKYTQLFKSEKYWKTLSGIIVAPVHRFTLLVGTMISELIMNSIPLLILFIVAFIIYPISIFYLLLSLLVFFSIFLIYSAIGLLIGAFCISKEGYLPYIKIFLRFIFLFSCRNYPKEIFPKIIQDLIVINPFFYLFDLLRLVWLLGVNYNLAISNITLIHILVIILFTILSPIISIFMFERIYKKYGITGY